MKKYILFIWLSLFSITMSFADSATMLITPGVSVGKVKLGQSRDEVKKIFGSSDKSNAPNGSSWSFNQAEYAPSIRIEFKSDKVYAIHFFNPNYKTSDGKNIATIEAKFIGYSRKEHIDPTELPSNKKIRNLRFVHPQGGLAFYKFDVDNADVEQRDLEYSGVVFRGVTPSDDNESEWK